MLQKQIRVAVTASVVLLGAFAFRANGARSAREISNTTAKIVAASASISPSAAPAALAATDKVTTETVVLAGGCFWGVQAVFQHTRGVISARSGYAGGQRGTATYEEVSTGTTGHAEAVKVIFDPSKVTYQQLLTIFFSVVHDPTELNRQGPDHGTQYRSEVFTTTPEQKKATEDFIAALTAKKVYNHPIVTVVAPLNGFFEAEAYHQDYATLHPDNMYIAINDLPKVENLRKQFPAQYRAELK